MTQRTAANEATLARILAAGATRGGLRKAWWALADQIEDCDPKACGDWDVVGSSWNPAAWAIDFNKDDELIEIVMFEIGPLSAKTFWERAQSVNHFDSSSYNKVCLVSICDGLVALWRHVEELGYGLYSEDLLPRPTWMGSLDELIKGMCVNGIPHHTRCGPDVLVVPNRAVCSHRGTLVDIGGKPFTSYFVNDLGDQWIFNFDGKETAILSGGDLDWEWHEVAHDGTVNELILDLPERGWVAACALVANSRREMNARDATVSV